MKGRKSQFTLIKTGKTILLTGLMAAYWLVFMKGLMKWQNIGFLALATISSTVLIASGRSWGIVKAFVE